MAKKSKRHSDATSIVGEELANDLESKSQNLVGKSDELGIDPSAVVLKDKHGFPPGEKEEEEGMATGTAEEEAEEGEKVERAYGGALTLNQAEAFLVREKGDGVLLGDWGVLAGVLTNITGDEHAPAIREELKQFQSRIDVMAVKALADLNRQEEIMPEKTVAPVEDPTEEPQAETPETEEQPEAEAGSEEEIVEKSEKVDEHALDSAVIAVRDAYDEALATPIDAQSRLKMIQPSLNDLGKAIMSRVDETGSEESVIPSGGVTLESIQQIVTQAVAPLAADVEAIKQRSAADASKRAVPERRAVTGRFFEAHSSLDKPVPGATARLPDELAAASGLEAVNPQFSGPKQLDAATNTPNLRNLIRRSVGIRE